MLNSFQNENISRFWIQSRLSGELSQHRVVPMWIMRITNTVEMLLLLFLLLLMLSGLYIESDAYYVIDCPDYFAKKIAGAPIMSSFRLDKVWWCS